MRDRKNESRAVFGELTVAQKAGLVDLLKSKDIELVNGIEGLTAWSFTRKAEDEFLKLAKAGKAEIKTKFPKRFDRDGNEITADKLKDVKVEELLDASEVAPVLKEKRDAEMIAELEKELESMTIAQMAEKYGLKAEKTRALMIEAVINLVKSKGGI